MDHPRHPTRELVTVSQFAQRYPAWTERSLRALIYAAEDRIASGGRIIRGNGMRECGAVVNCGRRVLLDPAAFLGPWLAGQQRNRQRRAT